MSYVLENDKEFARLEWQSRLQNYDYRQELRTLKLGAADHVLDAGCGSGIVCRYLAGMHPGARITGCDLSESRIALANKIPTKFSNLRLETQDLTLLSYASESFDAVVCRYVLQHLPPAPRLLAAKELFRVLKPGGKIFIIDGDGFIANLYPQSPFVSQSLQRLIESWPVDFFVGRKIPDLLASADFSSIKWQTTTVECQGTALSDELTLMKERFDNARPALEQYLGDAASAARFTHEYLAAMQAKEAVYSYSKFTVTALKAKTRALQLIKGRKQ